MSLVQPIIVTKNGSHEQTVIAATLASYMAYLNTIERPEWAQWLAGPFTKTVRRGNPSIFTQALEMSAAHCYVDEVTAAAFVPQTYDEMLPPLRRMQVAGLVRPREGWGPKPEEPWYPTIAFNPDVELTTGKACAQAAHGLWVWTLHTPTVDISAWVANGMPLHITDDRTTFAQLAEHGHTIHDAGWTEIDSGTLTVASGIITHA